MNILTINTNDITGGAESVAWNLFDSFKRRGHHSWFAVGLKRSNDPNVIRIPNDQHRDPWARFCIALGNILLPSSLEIRGTDRLRSMIQYKIGQPGRTAAIRSGCEDFDAPGTRYLLHLTPKCPDILHCHNLHGRYFDLRALPYLSHRIPVVLTLHDAWLLSGHCAHSFECERWRIGCGQCPDLSIYPSIAFDSTERNWQIKKEIYRNSKLYVSTPCKWLMEKAMNSMLAPSLKGARVIPNGVDPSIFHPGDQYAARRELGLSHTSRIVLYAANGGSKSPWRNFRQLETAMQKLALSSAEELLLICLGQRNVEQDRLSGNLRVKHFGFEKDPKRMALFYQSADVYALPALTETFPTTIIEAMACGAPVVATAVGGIPEQIIDGETGFLVPQSDVTAIATAIWRLFADVSLHQRMGNAAAEHARRFFGLDRQVNSFLSWYDEVQRDWLEWKRHEESKGN